MEPRARRSDNRGFKNAGPCGGTERGNTHFMASAGSRNYIQWKTLKSNENANCTVRISTGSENERDFKTIFPRDGSANFDGKFPCGRNAGFAGKEFRLPSEFNCDHCVLSFT